MQYNSTLTSNREQASPQTALFFTKDTGMLFFSVSSNCIFPRCSIDPMISQQ